MQAFFSIRELLTQRVGAGEPYLEFLRVPAMSSGIYVLPLDAADTQTPHAEDEIYFVISGSAHISTGHANGEAIERKVAAGDLIFVPARQEHRFHSITEELILLVIFAPAESS